MEDANYCRRRAAEERRIAAKCWLIINRNAHHRAAAIWARMAESIEGRDPPPE